MEAIGSYRDRLDRFEDYGIFVNSDTLETDLFRNGLAPAMIETLKEVRWSAQRRALLGRWEADPETMDKETLLKMIEALGKGRFAQRLAPRLAGEAVPGYIRRAIRFVVERV